MGVGSWRVSVQKIRNLFKTGSVGTVSGRNLIAFTTTLEDIVTAMSTGNPKALVVYRYTLDPDLGTATYIHAAIAQQATARTVTTAITNPDFPRTVTVKGNASGITGNVVVTGTNFDGNVITDTIALNGTSEVEGIKAFKTVTKFVLPIETHAGTDTVSVGVGNKIGMPVICRNALCLLVKTFNGSTDAGSMAVDSDEVEKNLFTAAGTFDGSKVLDLYYVTG